MQSKEPIGLLAKIWQQTKFGYIFFFFNLENDAKIGAIHQSILVKQLPTDNEITDEYNIYIK